MKQERHIEKDEISRPFLSPEKALILGIINQAALDACEAPSFGVPTEDALDAVRFLYDETSFFKAYCALVDLDPGWMRKSLEERMSNENLMRSERHNIGSEFRRAFRFNLWFFRNL